MNFADKGSEKEAGQRGQVGQFSHERGEKRKQAEKRERARERWLFLWLYEKGRATLSADFMPGYSLCLRMWPRNTTALSCPLCSVCDSSHSHTQYSLFKHFTNILNIIFAHKMYCRSFIKLKLNYWCHVDYFIVYFNMPLLTIWALNVSVVLLSMQGLIALRFHQKYLNLCSKDEWRSYGFGTTWGRIINRIFMFRWAIPLIRCSGEFSDHCYR